MERFVVKTSDYQSKANFLAYLNSIDGTYLIEIAPKSNTRSHASNKYYHGVVLKNISKFTGNTSNDTHILMKEMFLDYGVESTSELNSIDFEEYCERIRTWASSFLGLSIPTPNEVIDK
jgi:hypothetical protein